ncbi:50S ribosomal protein L32 [Maridesulfovibrio frigidus]|uniref:50S ribosomal protein L32 n=1 Tax=Maridesulfovibrio frigidus TaxID=340956 RepID=UPI0004E26D79|nr:50S ribosomal protein L32 [Maridesulfovibrio frigidus]OEU65554.1 MAG: 50S ribosomal protein L32 [Desulfovibrio sp. S3730MH75]
MAQPKKKTSKSRRGMRRSHDALTPPNVIFCDCGEPIIAHRACSSCGSYKGRQVINTEDA